MNAQSRLPEPFSSNYLKHGGNAHFSQRLVRVDILALNYHVNHG